MFHRQLRYFVSVVDCGSFTGAAEQNHISQSAISQQIQALEQDLGIALLVRENRRFRLTPAGDYFYRQGRTLLQDIDALKTETIRLGSAGPFHRPLSVLSCCNAIAPLKSLPGTPSASRMAFRWRIYGTPLVFCYPPASSGIPSSHGLRGKLNCVHCGFCAAKVEAISKDSPILFYCANGCSIALFNR